MLGCTSREPVVNGVSALASVSHGRGDRTLARRGTRPVATSEDAGASRHLIDVDSNHSGRGVDVAQVGDQ